MKASSLTAMSVTPNIGITKYRTPSAMEATEYSDQACGRILRAGRSLVDVTIVVRSPRAGRCISYHARASLTDHHALS